MGQPCEFHLPGPSPQRARCAANPRRRRSPAAGARGPPPAGKPPRQCSDFTPIFIGMHRDAPLSPMAEGARVHHSYGSYAPPTYGFCEPRRANPSTALRLSAGQATDPEHLSVPWEKQGKVPYSTAPHTTPHRTLRLNKNREALRQRKLRPAPGRNGSSQPGVSSA
jgi:hypothetical protein